MKHRAHKHAIFQPTTLIAGVLLLLIVFVTAGYVFFLSPPGQPPVAGDALSLLDAQRAKWQRERPIAFRYVVERHCFCLELYVQPYVVTEDDDLRNAAFAIPFESTDGSMHEAPPEPVFIDDVFDAIETAIADGTPVDVRYDRQWGFPADTTIGSLAADAGYQYLVRDFDVTRYAGR
ncbi:MAG: DUF6174 domain-containing protein [Woeseiaceae bacterium]|nr:DUF6174 domain-containing protein [Woeseiaceae bacterium]